jgi:hypothetical protein
MAPGSAAKARTTRRSATSRTQRLWKSVWASGSLRVATARVRTPPVVRRPASGTTRRFATTPRGESWPKWMSITGVTPSCAPADTARALAIGPGHHGTSRARIHGLRWRRPAVAANDSWRPGSTRLPGSRASNTRRAAARLFQTRLSRPRRPAARNRLPMTVARSTDGWPPTTAANAMSVASASPAARGTGRRTSLRRRNAEPATSATLKPEMARTWKTPARRKSASKVGGSWRRSPMRRPSRSEPDTAGRWVSMTSWIHSRVRSHQGMATGGRCSTPVVRAVAK